MKVYLVCYGIYSDDYYHKKGIFSTKELAEKCINELKENPPTWKGIAPDWYDVEEYEVDGSYHTMYEY